ARERSQQLRMGSAVRSDRESYSIARLAGSKSVKQLNTPEAGPIPPGTPLTQVLHTSQISLTSSAGTDEQYFDGNNDLVADQRTTLDSDGGSFDIAVGRSGARYEVFSA